MSHSFRTAVETRDLDGLRDALHPTVVFRSPAVHKPYEGREAVVEILGHAMEVFHAFRYTDELTGVGSSGLVFRARVGDRDVEGLDLLRVDASGLVRELTVMVRPLSGLTALADAMAARLSAG